MRVLRLTQAQPAAAAAVATAAAATAAATDSSSSSGSSGASGPTAAAASAGGGGPLQGLAGRVQGGVNPVVSLVSGVLQQPLVRESAQAQLRRELQGK